MPTVSLVESPEPQIVTLNNDSNEPPMPYGLGRKLPIIPPSLNNLNLPANAFNILATMAPISTAGDGYHDNYSPQSPQPSDPSPTSTPPMNVSTFNKGETPHTITADQTFFSEDEPQRVNWTSPLDKTFHSEGQPRRIYLLSKPSPQSPPRRMKRKLEIGMSFPKKVVSQHFCEACGQMIPSTKDIPGTSTMN